MRYYEYMLKKDKEGYDLSEYIDDKGFPNVGFVKDEEVTWGRERDNVNHPPHYGNGSIECIDYLEDFLTKEEFIGYLRGNIGKYLHRWRYKNGLEDLRKAEVYLSWLINVVETGGRNG